MVGRGASANMLLVDDNRMSLNVLRDILRPYNFHIEESENGYEAVEKCLEKKYDLIFMDYMMPMLNGVEAAQVIRERENSKNHDTKIIILSANTGEKIKERNLVKLFDGFLQKPIDQYELGKMITSMIPNARKERKPNEYSSKKEIMQEKMEFLLKVVYQEGDERIKELEELYQLEDMLNYKVLVHGLVGTAAEIKEYELQEKAKLAEAASAVENMEKLKLYHKELIECYQKLMDKLEKKYGSNRNSTLIKPEQIYEQIKECVQNKKLKQAQRMIEILLQKKSSQEYRRQLYRLKAVLSMQDYELAEQLLEEISQK